MRFLKKHYHWIIAFIVFLEMLIYGGICNSISVFIIPLTESLGVSRSSLSIAISVRQLTSFLGTLITASFLQRYDYKVSSIFCLLSAALSLALMAVSKSLIMIGLGNALFGLSYGICTTAGSVWIIKRWFCKHQGLVLGIVSMASGFGGSLMTMWLTQIIELHSWQYAYGFAALTVLFIAAIYLLLQDKPETMRLQPYGSGFVPKKAGKTIDSEFPGHTLKELLRLPQFYLMVLCTLLSSICVLLPFNVFVPHFQDQGYSASEAAQFFSVAMLISSFAKLLCGWLSDRIGAKKVTILCACFAMAGLLLLADVSNPITSFLGTVSFSLGFPASTIIVPLLTMPLFGYRAYSNTVGIFLSITSIGNLVSGPLGNAFFDSFGSYRLILQIVALLNALVIVLYFILFALCAREKKRQLSAT